MAGQCVNKIPLLPLALIVMSIPLIAPILVGLFVQFGVLPMPIFFFVYGWRALSFDAVPALLLADVAVIFFPILH